LGVAVGEPRYVTSIDAATATVVLGRRSDLAVSGLKVEMLTSVSGGSIDGEVEAQYRAHAEPVPAGVVGDTVQFVDRQEAVAAGQTISFYAGEEVLGGAVIAEVHR
jgi:tRNA-specific 2-thiouridylase